MKGLKTMDFKVERKDGNLCVIDITVDEKKANQEYENACKRIAQRINIEGFRRGNRQETHQVRLGWFCQVLQRP